jgi:hypothetical protein
MRIIGLVALTSGSLPGFTSAALAGACTGPDVPIQTDRPDVTNSAVVVPVGGFQNENDVDLQRKDGTQAVSGSNSRWRLGVAPCFEVLVDMPNYFATFRGAGPSGFSHLTPAVKWQLNLPQSKFDLSITAGAALPIGATVVSGPSLQPYLQIPWSLELGDGWALNGMETNFFTPEAAVKFTYQSTLSIEKEIAERAFVFVEYVGNFPASGGNNQLINSGAGYRIDKNHQIDFHIGLGLDRNAPNYIFGFGYSFLIDRVFLASHP